MPPTVDVPPPADFREFPKQSILQAIHQRIEEQVRLRPAQVALRTRDATYTYTEMNGLANSAAAEVLSVAGETLAQAAILQSNTPELIVNMLACLKAHKAYVPLDPNFPKQRLQTMLEDAEPAVLLTDESHLPLAEELAGRRVRIVNTSAIERRADAPNPQVACDPLDRAYILYTSGSTGRPKGIAFLHRNLLHTTMCLTNNLYFAPSDRVTWLHSASFAASVVDIYCCLTNGGTLYPWDAKVRGFTGLADWLVKERVTTFQWIPSAFRQFLRTVPDTFVFRDIRLVVMASETLTLRDVELFRWHFPVGSHLINQVGTSESYNYNLYPMDHNTCFEGAVVPGGYPVSGDRQVLILDGQRHRVPEGAIGEIAIKSNYMSAGYWRDDALTQKKFAPIDADGVPVYSTGDLGKLEPDGRLIHLGRKDSQVKIRGYRVELAEIDHALAAAPGVADSAACLVKDRLGQDRLVGYIILKQSCPFHPAEIEKAVESVLPEYMVPRQYVVLDSFPSLPTGKVDRSALPNPFDAPEPATRPEAVTSTSAEDRTAQLFRELLQLREVRPDSDFLSAGGDSLLMAVLLQRVHQLYGVEIPIDGFLAAPTPNGLASLIHEASEGGGRRRSDSKTAAEVLKFLPPARIRAAAANTQRGDLSEGRKNLVIISAGRLGREVFTWAAQAIAAGAPLRIKGFLDDRPHALDGYTYDAGILGAVDTYTIEADDVFVGAIGDPMDKAAYYTPIVEKGGKFVNIIHPLANIGHNVQLGAGIVLAPFSSITSDIKVGNHVAIGAFSNLGHDTAIGDWCQISSHCGVNGKVVLADGVFLGSHACIIPNLTVGAWAYVGAGSIVVRSVEPQVKVFGNPAAPIGRVEWTRR
jgi:sugar O-acyltransferase (sialic acid O-acetyltransferase NeuD family)